MAAPHIVLLIVIVWFMSLGLKQSLLVLLMVLTGALLKPDIGPPQYQCIHIVSMHHLTTDFTPINITFETSDAMIANTEQFSHLLPDTATETTVQKSILIRDFVTMTPYRITSILGLKKMWEPLIHTYTQTSKPCYVYIYVFHMCTHIYIYVSFVWDLFVRMLTHGQR